MGQNLILNMNDHGFTVVAYNRTTSKVDDFMKGNMETRAHQADPPRFHTTNVARKKFGTLIAMQ